MRRTLLSEVYCVKLKVALVDFTSVLSFSTGHLKFKFSMTVKMLPKISVNICLWNPAEGRRTVKYQLHIETVSGKQNKYKVR
jgi:hypothetical protein